MIIGLIFMFLAFFCLCCFSILTRNDMKIDSEGLGVVSILGMIVSLILIFVSIFIS